MKEFLKLSVAIFITIVVVVIGVLFGLSPFKLAEHYNSVYYTFLLLFTVPISMTGIILFFANFDETFNIWD